MLLFHQRVVSVDCVQQLVAGAPKPDGPADTPPYVYPSVVAAALQALSLPTPTCVAAPNGGLQKQPLMISCARPAAINAAKSCHMHRSSSRSMLLLTLTGCSPKPC